MTRPLIFKPIVLLGTLLLVGCSAEKPVQLDDYTPLSQVGKTYPTDHVFEAQQGTLSVWMKFDPDRQRRDHLVFSTDDSRYVLFVDTYRSQSAQRSILRIGARAGGNRRVVDSRYKGGNFPEASIIIDNDGALANYGKATPCYASVPFPMGQWQHVAMTWQGVPEGTVRIYLNGQLIGEKPYDDRYDDGRKPATSMAVGQRPRKWTGELTLLPTGNTVESVPKTTMQLAAGSIEIQDLRLYRAWTPTSQMTQLMQHSQRQIKQ